jgi:hypothetical protein
MYSVLCLLGTVAHAQVDTPAAREARSIIRELRGSYGTQSAWRNLAIQASLDEVEFELRAGDRAQRAALDKAIAVLRSANSPQLRSASLARLPVVLEARANQLAAIPRELWAQACRDNAERYVAIRPDFMARERNSLAVQLNGFQRRLPSIARPGDAWNAFLMWTETQWLPGASAIDPGTLDQIEARWRCAPWVWDAPELLEASLAVQSYVRLLRGYLSGESADDHRAAWLDIARLADASGPTTQDQLTALTSAVIARERLGQSCPVTAAMRRELSQANVLFRAKTGWLQSMLGGITTENYRIDDVYGGARTVGNGAIATRMQLEVTPSTSIAHWLLRLDGTALAATVGGSEGVRVSSRAATSVRGEKRFTLGTRGLLSTPAWAGAASNIQYTSVDAPGRGRRRSEAVQQTYARKPGAERDAAAATERSVRSRMDEEGRKLATEFNRSFLAQLRDQQLATYRAATEMRVRSQGDAIWFECWLEDPLRFAAPGPPNLFEFEADAVVSLAASALEEQVHPSLSGRRLGADALAKAINALAGQQSAPAAAPNDFSVEFAARPCEFDINDGEVRVRFFVNSFDSTEVTYPAMTIDARYRLEQRPAGVVLFRDGGVRVRGNAEVSGGRTSGRQQTLRLAVERKLNKALPVELVWAVPKLPMTDSTRQALAIRSSMADHGWLQIAFTRRQ